tara:strand:+ start:485 stop:697 length:213 start_codon:yes stop_codon:yes gene_type:complete
MYGQKEIEPLNKIKKLREAQEECLRFIKKADLAINDLSQGHYGDLRKMATARRAAIDTSYALQAINRIDE